MRIFSDDEIVKLNAWAAAKTVDSVLGILRVIATLPRQFTADDVSNIARLQYAHEHLLAAQLLLDQVASEAPCLT